MKIHRVTLKFNFFEWELIPKKSIGIHSNYKWLFIELRINYIN
jgi:hypothetical protein